MTAASIDASPTTTFVLLPPLMQRSSSSSNRKPDPFRTPMDRPRTACSMSPSSAVSLAIQIQTSSGTRSSQVQTSLYDGEQVVIVRLYDCHNSLGTKFEFPLSERMKVTPSRCLPSDLTSTPGAFVAEKSFWWDHVKWYHLYRDVLSDQF